MTTSLQQQSVPSDQITNRDMAEGLRKALEKNHTRILQAAGTEWERRFAGRDPSDACVSVHVSAWDRALSGHSTEMRPALPLYTAQAT